MVNAYGPSLLSLICSLLFNDLTFIFIHSVEKHGEGYMAVYAYARIFITPSRVVND